MFLRVLPQCASVVVRARASLLNRVAKRAIEPLIASKTRVNEFCENPSHMHDLSLW
jgi:hypothetical protein